LLDRRVRPSSKEGKKAKLTGFKSKTQPRAYHVFLIRTSNAKPPF